MYGSFECTHLWDRNSFPASDDAYKGFLYCQELPIKEISLEIYLYTDYFYCFKPPLLEKGSNLSLALWRVKIYFNILKAYISTSQGRRKETKWSIILSQGNLAIVHLLYTQKKESALWSLSQPPFLPFLVLTARSLSSDWNQNKGQQTTAFKREILYKILSLECQ